jgi:streptomycin 6-kinase
MPITVPPVLAANVAAVWGDEGRRWLASLPGLVTTTAARWRLSLGRPYDLSLNWVMAATRADGSPVVLKIGVPDGHLAREAAALRAFGGHGAVRLLAEEPGALLIERAVPGDRVAALVPGDDAAATDALMSVAQALHVSPGPGMSLPHLRGEGQAFRAHLARFPGDDPLPRRLVETAAGVFDDLCGDSAADVVLHGDLHHDNVLRGDREPWLAIDPFGRIGDPGFDCAPMLYNPDPPRRSPELLTLVPSRLEQMADRLAIPVDRVAAWGFVMGVLSEVWNAQGDSPVGTRALDVARSLYPVVSGPARGR